MTPHTPSDTPRPSKRQCLPKFRVARQPEPAPQTRNKSWVTRLTVSGDHRIRPNAKEHVHAKEDVPLPVPLPSPQPTSEASHNGQDMVLETDECSPKRKRDRTNCSQLTQWLGLRDSTLDELLRLEGLGSSAGRESCIVCSEGPLAGLFRCLDCGHGCSLYCRNCLVAKHCDLELHRVQKWNGRFFEKTTLSKLGLRVQLGHDGGKCSCPLPGPKNFVVFDSSGAHPTNIDYCGCNSLQPDCRIQLLRKRWFPATFLRPQTAFTFDSLDTFHELTLQGKANLYDFYHTILRKTDNANIEVSMYRLPEMHRVFRLWRHMMSLKRAGRGHDPSGVEGTSPGGLVVECPACPQPGRNLPTGWETAGPLLYLYILYLAVDGNFKLKGKDRKLQDVDFTPGYGVFVEQSAYQTHLQHYVDQKEINTCQSEHDAVVRASTRNSPGYSVSGVGLVMCSRHSLVRKNGAGDLQKGERYCNMDYIILSALLGVVLPWILITYDIACQWSKNFEKRMSEGFPDHMKIRSGTKVDTAIPSWHINGHGESCRQNFCLGFMKGAGRTCGEEIEIGWSHTNPLATSTREMGPSARHETLNDHWNGWNFRKIVGFPTAFQKKFADAAKMKRRHEEIFECLSEMFSTAVVSKWTSMVERWEADSSAPNPYAEPYSGTTLQDVRLKLLQEEAAEGVDKEGSPPHKMTLTGFITTALEIEDRQYQLRCEVANFSNVGIVKKRGKTSRLQADTQDKRMALQQRIHAWRQAQLVYTPHAATMVAESASGDEDGVPRVEMAEHIPLFLPSAFPSNIRSLSEMKHICEVERKLRFAQAEDALVEIRRQRRVVQGLWQFKRINVSGTGNRPNTRILTLYKRITHRIERAAQKYRTARSALLVLDPEGRWIDTLKELRREDIRGPGKGPDEAKTTNGRFEPSWIWLVSRKGHSETQTQTEDEFNDSMRAEWAKTRARMMRWQEEYLIVQEEMRRVLAWFEWKVTWWEIQADRRLVGNVEVLHGVSAYAHKQAHVVRLMAARCAGVWLPVLRKSGIEPLWSDKYPLTDKSQVITGESGEGRGDSLADEEVEIIELLDDDNDDGTAYDYDDDIDDDDVDDSFEFDD